MSKSKILNELGLSGKLPIVLIFGGSQGAQKINEAVVGILKEKKLNQKYQIVWATGPKQFDIVKEELKKSSIDIEKVQNAKILPYIYNMEEIMNISDIIVARSGAMTITEISNLGKAININTTSKCKPRSSTKKCRSITKNRCSTNYIK